MGVLDGARREATGQVSTRLGWSRQGVINLAEDRRIRAVKVGGQLWIYAPESVENFAWVLGWLILCVVRIDRERNVN